MPKIIIRKGQKQFFEDLGRDVTIVKQKSFFAEDLSKDFSTQYGTIRSADLKKGGIVKSDQGKEFTIFDASFIDLYRRIKRLPQIIPMKDIGMMIATTGIGPETIVVEGGSGSGALAIMLARFAKKVYSYDVNDDHLEVVKENIKVLGIKNIVVKKQSLYEKIDEKSDVFCLDVPEPWLAIETAASSLSVGGFLVSYSPCLPQSIDFVNAILKRDDFLHLKTIDLIEQEWEIDGRKVRPKSKQIIHSGFLSFARKIK